MKLGSVGNAFKKVGKALSRAPDIAVVAIPVAGPYLALVQRIVREVEAAGGTAREKLAEAEHRLDKEAMLVDYRSTNPAAIVKEQAKQRLLIELAVLLMRQEAKVLDGEESSTLSTPPSP